jgi:fucose permease
MNPRRLFIASCISLVASAFSFVIRGDILPALGETFLLNYKQRGAIGTAAFLGMALAMLVGAPICDHLGMKRMIGLAFLCHLVGTLGTIFAPNLVAVGLPAYDLLLFSTLLVGCANGFVEIGINPLAATLYPNKKTHMLNVLHAWWPGGLMMGGLIAVGMSRVMGLGKGGIAVEGSLVGTQLGWQLKMALILIPMLIYGFMFLTLKFPVTERVASGVSSREMYREALRPMFLLWAFCMLLTAATELGPQQWQESILSVIAGISGTLILVYTSSLMFLGRHFAGALAHKFSPVGMLTGSATLSAIGLYWLSFANNGMTAFLAATVFGLGIIYFWPTMLGVTAERFPKGGAFLLGLMGCVGNCAVATNLFVMGGIYDSYIASNLKADAPAVYAKVVDPNGSINEDRVNALGPEDGKLYGAAKVKAARMPFRYVSVLPMALIVIFGGIALYDRSRGGYKPEVLRTEDKELSPAELASDY